MNLGIKTHGLSKTRLYMAWLNMKKRCEYPKANNYWRYGGRGISVDPVWSADFLSFKTWSEANGYQSHLILDRKDNNGNYTPDNCRWVTRKVSNNNKTDNCLITVAGETKSIKAWSEDNRCSVDYKCLHQRFRRGWSAERAIFEPA